jgi:hypothetical protein
VVVGGHFDASALLVHRALTVDRLPFGQPSRSRPLFPDSALLPLLWRQSPSASKKRRTGRRFGSLDTLPPEPKG